MDKKKRGMIILMATVILLNLTGDFFSNRELTRFINQNQKLLRDMSFRDKLNDLRSDILLIESRVRGLVVTGKVDFVADIDSNFLKAFSTLNEILDMTSLDPEQRLQGDSLNIVVRKKIQISKKILNVYLQNGKAQAENFISTGEEKRLRQEFLALVVEMDMFKHNTFVAEQKAVEKHKEEVIFVDNLLTWLSTACFIVLAYLILRSVRRRDAFFSASSESFQKERSAYLIRDQFIANISHEIRTPLNSVIGYSGLLQKTELSTTQFKFVGAIQHSAESLLQIINELLDFGKIQEGTMDVKKEQFHLAEMGEQLGLMFQESFRKKNIEYHIYCDESIPKYLSGDAVKLRQILVNLINNALKFTDKGKVEVHFNKKNSTPKGIILRIEVSDTGIGISPQHLPHIFERFYQAESSLDRKYGGTGLGLAIIHQFIELMGGSIEVQSKLKTGSHFIVELPFDVTDKPDVEKQMLSFGVRGISRKRVLVVDDNALNLDLTTHVLSAWNLEVASASSGRQAMHKLQQEKFDLVLMDVQMPGLDGYETTLKIRSDINPTIPIIALTAHSNETEEAKSRNAGMNGYISKPFDEIKLFKMINGFLFNTKLETKEINFDYLENISKGNKAFETKILARFIEETPRYLEELSAAVNKNDISLARQIIHTMKANVSVVGLEQILDSEFTNLMTPGISPASQNDSLQRVKNLLGQAIEEIHARKKS